MIEIELYQISISLGRGRSGYEISWLPELLWNRPARRIEKSHICTEPVSLNYVCLWIEQWLLHPLHLFSRDYWTYWLVSGVQMSGEWREWRAARKKKSGRKSKKKSSMSITQWRLYFHYKCIRPQLVDLQLNTFFFFILRLHNRRKFSHICFSHNSFLNNWECYILAP